MDVSFPYFIPGPTLVGTFGAFIAMKSPISDRNALIDIGAAGPLAGLAVTIPVLFVGLVSLTGRPGGSNGRRRHPSR